MTERILSKEEKRYTLFPLRYPDLEDLYKKSVAQFWIPESIDLSNDKFDELLPMEKEYLKNLLGFFAGSDGIVNDNIDSNFLSQVQILEAKRFYNFQMAVEDIHSDIYSRLIETYIKDSTEKDKMFNAIEDMPAVKKKAAWALKWLEQGSFVEKLIAFAVVEG